MTGDLSNSDMPGLHLELALKASEGDDVAARTLFAEFYKPLRSYVQLRMNPELQSRLDASDIVQETFVEANRRLKEYLQRQSMPLRIWLYKLASKQLGHARVKHLIREKRATSREVSLPDRSSLLLADHLSRNATPSEHVSKKERDRELAKLINQLGGVEREILVTSAFGRT